MITPVILFSGPSLASVSDSSQRHSSRSTQNRPETFMKVLLNQCLIDVYLQLGQLYFPLLFIAHFHFPAFKQPPITLNFSVAS